VDGYYLVDNLCHPCDPNCRTCEGNSIKCTKCKENTYLLNGSCTDVCPELYFQDNLTNICESCIPPCTTCLGLYYCLTCNSDRFYIYEGICYTVCPKQAPLISGSKCLACSSNC